MSFRYNFTDKNGYGTFAADHISVKFDINLNQEPKIIRKLIVGPEKAQNGPKMSLNWPIFRSLRLKLPKF